MLKIEDLLATYNEDVIIDGLSYTFENGKNYAITGSSGIGKTTLLNIISGLKKPTRGNVTLENEKLSYIFQEPRLFPWLTAVENVKLVCGSAEKASSLIDTLIKDIDAKEKYPSELSGGMKQRIAIARALSYDGDIILMDEPFKGLDAELKDDVRRFVFEYLKDKTVILVTHDHDDLVYCDTVLKMCGAPVSHFQSAESGNYKTE